MHAKEQPAPKRKPANRLRLLRAYLYLWLVPGLCLLVFHLIAAPDSVGLGRRLVAGAANLAGPWAGFLIEPGTCPTLGELLAYPLTLIHTGLLLLLAAVSLATRSRLVRVLCASLLAPLLIAWLVWGLLQITATAA